MLEQGNDDSCFFHPLLVLFLTPQVLKNNSAVVYMTIVKEGRTDTNPSLDHTGPTAIWFLYIVSNLEASTPLPLLSEEKGRYSLWGVA